MSEYPEHDKLAAVREQSQAIGEFLDLGPYHLCELLDIASPFSGKVQYQDFQPVAKTIPEILADWFGIDQRRLEREKRAMLAHLRWLNDPTPVRPVTRAVSWPANWTEAA